MPAITFGTDGIRGRAFDEVSLRAAYLIGRAAADVFGGETAVIGADTRASGPALTAALAAGLHDGGVEALDLGVAPTPAVAHAAGQRGVVGVVVSASHNPWHDNGVKLFSPHGSKLSDEDQAAVEARLAELADYDVVDEPSAPLRSIQPDVGAWVRSVTSSITTGLDGLHAVVDCANGAASHVVPPALADLGATVTPIFNEPDGQNINDGCGSTYLDALADRVVAEGADVGLAFDGDADRLLAVDHRGQPVDGDQLMAALALDLDGRGRLARSQLVVTVYSNLGLLHAMRQAGIAVEVTPVGDRNVLIALDRLGATLGGEQSGHLIFREHAGTGDGFLSAVNVLELMARTGQPLADLVANAMTVFPQVMRNVAVSKKMPDIAERIASAIAVAEADLGEDGRVLVRASGTEPVVRVMVEAADRQVAEMHCDRLSEAVAQLAQA